MQRVAATLLRNSEIAVQKSDAAFTSNFGYVFIDLWM